MSWMTALYETFDNNQALLTAENPLTPMCHTTQQAHIEVVIDGEGQFLRAAVVPREHNTTIVPCTERSSSRAGIRPVNHPLCDKLQYLAGDFTQFGGVVTGGFAKDPKEPHRTFLEELAQWEFSPFGHPKVTAILRYLRKGTLMADLVNHGVLHVDEQGRVLEKWNKEADAPEIFQLLRGNIRQYDAFVRWIVEIPGVLESTTWKDETLIQAWADYYLSTISERDICYVTGKETGRAQLHPSGIRRAGDRAKLISSNDTSNFTFRGRFQTASQAANVGLEVTQKAHHMLSWLVQNQGFVSFPLAVVAWATSGPKIPNPVHGTPAFIGSPTAPEAAYTAEELARKLKNKILSLQADLGEFANVNVIGLDSATPGRMSISFYKELWSSEFLKRLETWHSVLAWTHSYRPRNAPKDFAKTYLGAPSLFDIANVAYASRIDDKLRAKTIKRLLPCVIEGQPLPKDIVDGVVRRASNRVSFEQNWEWTKALTIACSLYKGANPKEGYTVALDTERVTRDYLYGRLLAYADNLEKWALSESGEQRPTNAARMMNRFADRPFSTWRNLELALRPYKDRLGPRKIFNLEKGISEVMALFNPDDFTSDKPLSGEFLLGYHCQMMAFWPRDEK